MSSETDLSTSPSYPDRSRETNNALSEVRTILSRAETSLRLIDARPWAYRDPELMEMRQELQATIDRLSRWRRRR